MASSLTVTSQLSEVGSKALHGLTCSLLDTWDSSARRRKAPDTWIKISTKTGFLRKVALV